ncbi:hypothetical protein C8F01DRAFT_1130146 [Mycena amicta]|nr:hypothetical protein C8F01DRAFT_1130146 [Mycena amicta]
MLLREANFTARFQTAHALVLGAFVLQLAAIPTAVYFGQRIEALLVLAAALIRLVEGIFSWTYPRFRTPRADAHRLQQDNVPRYLMLHTGMTTTHLLIVAHRVGYSGPFIVLEDAAVPLPPLHKSRYQDLARLALMLSVWLQKAAALFTSADGYFIPLALLFGTCVIELVVASESFTETTLPERAETVLTTGRSLLDRITAACQFTNQVSVGFVETLLPDPHGEHTDYHWIVQAMDPGEIP